MQVSQERRLWKRFGAAAKETTADSVTAQHTEEIPFERIRPAKATAQEKKITDVSAALQSADKNAIVGRYGKLPAWMLVGYLMCDDSVVSSLLPQ